MTPLVESVEITPFRLPLRRSVRYAIGSDDVAEHVLVAVRLADGTTGYGEAIPRPMVYGETLASVLDVLDRVLAPAAVGTPVGRPELFRARTRHLVGNPTARSAVELAMFDALARFVGLPAYQLLGGHAGDVAAATLLSWGRPDEVAAAAVEASTGWGVTAFKLKVGIDPDLDIATTRAVRTALGPDALLYADANQGYTSAQAARFVAATREAGLAWLEEPCPPGAVGGPAYARSSPVPVVGDESCPDPASAGAAVLAGRVGMVSIKTARTALRRSATIRDFCAVAGVDVVVGSQGESAVGTFAAASFAAATPDTSRYPAEVLYFLDLPHDIAREPPVVAGGRLRLPDRPGFGFELDTGALAAAACGPTVRVGAEVPVGR
ncbi:mandelate racemase/muconate lactonizing enzyme family protein [Polymorphospora lycopeni]|uniref:Enolase C-terminal domain-like protein n=1 Tax=Polymorphospora lycopeni TaxID=3140240 RepID=A0ABV5CMQ2_9ACTN